MPNSPAKHKLGETCPSCRRVHKTRDDNPACVAHSPRDGSACRRAAIKGLNVCWTHGGAKTTAREAGRRRSADAKAAGDVERLLGGQGQPVTDPVSTLCSLAGRAVHFMELLGELIDDTTDIGDGDLSDATQANLRIYTAAIRDASSIVESIIRSGIAERLAKQDAERTTAIVAFIDGVLADLGHNPRDPEVAGAVARRLELVS